MDKVERFLMSDSRVYFCADQPIHRSIKVIVSTWGAFPNTASTGHKRIDSPWIKQKTHIAAVIRHDSSRDYRSTRHHRHIRSIMNMNTQRKDPPKQRLVRFGSARPFAVLR